MAKSTQLKRIHFDGLPEAVVLSCGDLRFRHYLITNHAMDRFSQRYNRPAEDIVPTIHGAVFLDEQSCQRPKVRRLVRKAEERGGYVLRHNYCFFVVKPDEFTGVHIVRTVVAITG